MAERGRRRANLALLVLAGALAVALAADLALAPAPARVQDALLPELGRGAVVELAIERAGAPRTVLRAAGGAYEIVEPVRVPADPSAVRDLVGALELLALRRRLDPGGGEALDRLGLDPPRATLRVTLDSGVTAALALGGEAPGRGAWVRRLDSGEIYLVEAHAVRDLDRSADDLRRRNVFSLHRAPGAELTLQGEGSHGGAGALPAQVLRGRPLALALPGGAARVDPAAASELLALLDRLELSRFGGAAELPAAGLRIDVAAGDRREMLAERGACPGAPELRLIETSVGTGCVPAAGVEAIATLARRGRDLVDRHLAGGAGTVATVELEPAGGERRSVDASGVGGGAVREWLAELDRGGGAPVDLSELGAEVGALILHGSGGHQRIALHRRTAPAGSYAARRAGEGVALAVDGDAPALFFPPAHRFHELALLLRDPVDLRGAARHGARGRSDRAGPTEQIERGELLDEWKVTTPSGATPDAAAIDRLRTAVAPLEALRSIAADAAPAHRLAPPEAAVDLTFDPAPGTNEVQTFTIELGADTADGCYARMRGDPVVVELSKPRCAALRGPWTRQSDGR